MRTDLHCRFLGVVCGLQLAIISAAQTRPADPGQGRPPLQATTRLVQVSVIVHDRSGEPVADLTREDFALFDEGKEQAISFFSLQTNRVQARAPVPLSPNTFSNRAEHRGAIPTSVTVVLVDMLNTSWADQNYAKDQVLQFLKQLLPSDHVAIFLLGPSLVLLHDFTSDAAPLIRALEKVENFQSPELAATPDSRDLLDIPQGGMEERLVRRFNQFVRGSEQRFADQQVQNRAARSLEAIAAIAHRLERLPGRKNLIWVSGSFPFAMGLSLTEINLYHGQDSKILAPMIERTARAVTDANVAVYPVDARGLLIAFSKNPRFDRVPGSRSQERGGLAPDPFQVGRLGPAGENPNAFSPDETSGHFASMNLLADRTGGRAFYNTNDIRTAIRRAIDDSRVTYVLGYYPTHNEWNGRFHELKVRVRRLGLDVRSRTGYLASPDRPLDRNQRVAVLRDAAINPLEDTRLGMSVQVEPVLTEAGLNVRLRLQVDARDLHLPERQGQWVGGLDLLVVQRSSQGTTVDTLATTQPISLNGAMYQAVGRDGLMLSVDLAVKPEAHLIRVVVRDNTSGIVGSVDIPVARLKQSGS